MIKVLVTGANGQLGRCLQDVVVESPLEDYSFKFVDRNQLDITNAKEVEHHLSLGYDFLVNGAACTAVDKAEEEEDKAFSVNTYATGILAEKCYEHKTQFIHISTDYVFDGKSKEPIKVGHAPNPINVYGKSKLQGEKLAIEKNPNTIIIRTAWVYSPYCSNFVKTMLRLFKEKKELNVVEDQYGVPTNAHDLAKAIIAVITSPTKESGIFHFTNEGKTNWYEFAQEVKNITQSDIKINPIPTSAYPTPAKRPKYSVLDSSKIQNIYGVEIPNWKESLRKSLKE